MQNIYARLAYRIDMKGVQYTVRIPRLSLEGQVAIVTGARRGIGRDTALVLAEAGADVAVSDLVTKTGELDAVAKEIQGMGRRSLAGEVDAGKKAHVEGFVQKVVKEFGTVDILVNNAGVASGSGPDEPERFAERQKSSQEIFSQLMENPMITFWKEEDWDKVLSTNLKSVLIGTQAVVPIMTKNKKGAIINVASVNAYARGAAALDAYSVSKRGIVMLTEGLAADLGRFGIRVNSIAPGGIETEMMRIFWAQPETLQWLESRILLGNKMLQPLHCAHLILFLASELSHYVTGQTVVIDGGLTIALGA